MGHDLADANAGPAVGTDCDVVGDIPFGDQPDEFVLIVDDDQAADVVGEHSGCGFFDAFTVADRDDPSMAT